MNTSIYRLRDGQVLSLCVLSLILLGVIMVESASDGVTGQTTFSWTAAGQKHLIFALAAVVTYFGAGWLNVERLGRTPKSIFRSPVAWGLVIAILACTLVLVPGVGIERNHARRWLPLGPLQVEPSELAKWAVVPFLAYWLSRRSENLDRFFGGFIPMLAPVAVLCLLVVIQDFGTAMLIALCSLIMLVAGRVRPRHLLIVIPPALAAAYWFVSHREYRWRRMVAFMDPYSAAQKEGYQLIQSLLSFATGGLTGRGLGNGIQKLGYLPEDNTDFIFAVICEELGIFGALLTIALYLGILYIAWQSIRRQRDDFVRMLALGIGTMVGLQALVNIAVATVAVPTKGVSLPLVSAGGSGLVITCGALGLLLAASRCKPAPEIPIRPVRPVADD